jgi:hypothetical protein
LLLLLLLPYRSPLTTVVGAPIPVTAIDPKAVTPAEFEAAVDVLHAKYCTGTRALFVSCC